MQIVGFFEHPRLKITLFKDKGRYQVKLENGLQQYTLRFREDEISGLEHLRAVVDLLAPLVDHTFRTCDELRRNDYRTRHDVSDLEII